MRATALGLIVLCCVGCSSVPLEGLGGGEGQGEPREEGDRDVRPLERSLYTAELEGGTLQASVEKVTNNVRGRKVEVYIVLHNQTDQEVQFDLSQTLMTIAGIKVSAKDLPPYWDVSPDVKARSTRKKKWAFEVATPVEPGIYDLNITGLRFAGAGSAGGDLLIKVKVPGRASDSPRSAE